MNREQLIAKAKQLGKSVEDAAVDEIKWMKTDALNAILRTAIVSAFCGVMVGIYLGAVLFT